jgi:hypothetical protein
MIPDKVKAKIDDHKLVRRHKNDYNKAYAAAWFLLSDDRRFLGAPMFKRQICEVAALRAIGSDRSLFKEIQIASHKGDQKGADMLREGYDKACTAAKRALE